MPRDWYILCMLFDKVFDNLTTQKEPGFTFLMNG